MSFDFFIAHASDDGYSATALYRLLSSAGARVFLASESLKLGERWDDAIPSALNDSRVAIVVISEKTTDAYFQREEILQAIDLSRKAQSPLIVVPMYLGSFNQNVVPYGLRRVQSIQVSDINSLKETSSELRDMLSLVKRTQITPSSSSGRKIQTPDPESNLGRRIARAAQKYLKFDGDRKNEPGREKNPIKIASLAQANSFLESVVDDQGSLALGVVYLDVDRFKTVNEKCGRQIGDTVLKTIETICAEGPHVLACKHLLNDQFAVLVNGDEDVSKATALALVDIVKTHNWDQLRAGLYVTVSAGSVMKRIGEPVMESVVRAMHGAKFVKRSVGGSNVSPGTDYIPANAPRSIEYYDS